MVKKLKSKEKKDKKIRANIALICTVCPNCKTPVACMFGANVCQICQSIFEIKNKQNNKIILPDTAKNIIHG